MQILKFGYVNCKFYLLVFFSSSFALLLSCFFIVAVAMAFESSIIVAEGVC